MPNAPLPSRILVITSVVMIAGGIALGGWALRSGPFAAQAMPAAAAGASEAAAEAAARPPQPAAAPGGEAGEMATNAGAAAPPLLVVAPGDAPGGVASALVAAAESISNTVLVTTALNAAADVAPAIRFSLQPQGAPVYTVTFAAATRFDTIDPAINWMALRQVWAGRPAEESSAPGTPAAAITMAAITVTASFTAGQALMQPVSAALPLSAALPYTQVAVLSDTLPALLALLGDPGPDVTRYASVEEIVAAAWQGRSTLAILPFDQLQPRLAVLSIDGQNPLDNAAGYDPAVYPLIANVYATLGEADAVRTALARKALAVLPAGNRLPERLTVVAMTGVTAMTRQMAAQMDRLGVDWPAAEIGEGLAAADITHFSNEVPFVEGCETNLDPENFNFCSKPEYMKALTDAGVDIIGLTGNHQNDFGRESALKSLAMYEEAGLPVYGGGANKEAAFAPLIVEHNGNRLAFLGANSYGPKMAWATDDLPGSAEFDLAIMSAGIRELKQAGIADVVLAELQYQESYDTLPLVDQRQDFNALARAGADIVTGVQSHVPQGIEFTDGKLVLYGLGNLYFDQMADLWTREGLVVKHTIYDGRHIGTQILTTLLYDYGQPRWTTGAQRKSLLERVFAASYW
jgi:poly-gamma-glutamate synthesis protein (capsule biosynthesis protein)